MTGPGPSRRPDVAGLLRHMSAALRTARSVHISGTVRQGGKTLRMNLGLTGSGGLSGQIYENGAAFTVLATHGHVYLKLSAAFLRLAHLPASACSRYCGKYLEYPAARSRGLLTQLSLASLTHSLTRTPASKIKLFGAVTAGGQPAWLLQDQRENSIYVAAHGRAYVLRVVGPRPGLDVANLTQWNAVQIPGPPPPGQIVHPRQLRG